jgi:transcriptional regulator with XRE-family HTH domain
MATQAHSTRQRATNTDGRASETTTPDHVDVGLRLRRLRVDRGLSIRALAEASGLSVNTLSLIENGRTSPSVSTLQRVSAALDVPITAFFETDTPVCCVAHTKTQQRPRARFEHGTLEDLSGGLPDRAVQPFLVTLAPHSGSGSEVIVHTGYEFVFCLVGHLTYTVEDREYALDPGDSLLFESHLPHSWYNAEVEPCQALLVLYPTDAHDRPTERHFMQPAPRAE